MNHMNLENMYTVVLAQIQALVVLVGWLSNALNAGDSS